MSYPIVFLSHLPFEWARYEFMRNALLAVILVLHRFTRSAMDTIPEHVLQHCPRGGAAFPGGGISTVSANT